MPKLLMDPHQPHSQNPSAPLPLFLSESNSKISNLSALSDSTSAATPRFPSKLSFTFLAPFLLFLASCFPPLEKFPSCYINFLARFIPQFDPLNLLFLFYFSSFLSFYYFFFLWYVRDGRELLQLGSVAGARAASTDLPIHVSRRRRSSGTPPTNQEKPSSLSTVFHPSPTSTLLSASL